MRLFELLRELKFREVDDNWILVFDRYENIVFDSDESKLYELFEFLDKTVKSYTDDSCGSLRIPVLERYEFDETGEKVLVSAKVRGNYSFVWPAIEGAE